MSEKLTRVLIVDDHPLFRDRVVQLINQQSDLRVCAEVETAEQAIRFARDQAPDLAIIDITLKQSSGLELIKAMKANSIGAPILVLSMHEESHYAERALRIGASGYITKSQPAEEVLSAIRRVLAGEIYLSEKMTSLLLRNLAATKGKSAARAFDRLTDRELEVLELVGRGKTTRQIAENLRIGEASVDTYRARIKDKMNFRNAVQLQRFAVRWVRGSE
jgi:DNA-binding NarL/FixJ family response regulator